MMTTITKNDIYDNVTSFNPNIQRGGFSCNAIKSTTYEVVQNAKFVSIDNDKVKEFANVLIEKFKKNEIEKLLKFCELELDENCFNHHKNTKTPIKTVSISQAREPVYSSSVRSSDKYKDHLKEMFENLI